MLYNESTLRSAIADHKTINRYIVAHNGDCFLVFGMTADCVLVHRCIFKDGSLVYRPMMKIAYDAVKAVIEKPVLCESTGIAIEPPKPAIGHSQQNALLEIGGSTLDVCYPADTDLDTRFQAVCNDTGETLSINGWLIESIDTY